MLPDYFGFSRRQCIDLVYAMQASSLLKKENITDKMFISQESFLSTNKNINLANQSINDQNNHSVSMGKNALQNKSDEEVLLAFQDGNQLALEIIYDRYGSLVYRIIYKMLNNHQEAEDLTQEIFIILQERCNYNPEKGSFYTYLMMITRSRAIDKLRSKRSQGKFWQNAGKLKDLIGSSESTNNSLENISTKERINEVKKALDNLSAIQKQVLELSYYKGLSQSEIAKRLQIPLGTVKTHSRRGLLKLRQNLTNLLN